MMHTSAQRFRVDRRQIVFLRFILEGYDGMAVMRTVDAKKGEVVVHVAPGCEDDVDALLSALRDDVRLTRQEPPQPCDSA
jgi:hypothetical protein